MAQSSHLGYLFDKEEHLVATDFLIPIPIKQREHTVEVSVSVVLDETTLNEDVANEKLHLLLIK